MQRCIVVHYIHRYNRFYEKVMYSYKRPTHIGTCNIFFGNQKFCLRYRGVQCSLGTVYVYYIVINTKTTYVSACVNDITKPKARIHGCWEYSSARGSESRSF